MRHWWLARLRNQRGILLISSYLIVTALFLYSNTMVVRSLNQRIANDQMRNRLQDADLAQAAVEALREELYQFLTSDIYQDTYNSDPRWALAWLDSLDDATVPSGMRAFDPNRDGRRDGFFDSANPNVNPLCIASLPTVQGATTTTTKQVCSTTGSGKTTVTTCQNVPVTTPAACDEATSLPHAWVTKVENLGEDANGNGLLDAGEDLNKNGVLDIPAPSASYFDFYPRRVTIQAAARVNGFTRWVQADYLFSLNASSVFRYGYFINNFGWLDPGARQWSVNGDIRSNGDLLLGPTAASNLRLQGDAYASANPDAKNPLTLLSAQGTITGASGYINDHDAYYNEKSMAARPNRLLSLPSTETIKRPFIQAPYGWWMPTSWGWDTIGPDQFAPHYFPAQKAHDLPYIGNLELYRQRAQAENSRLIGRNQFGQLQTVTPAYTSTEPLVLIGTAAAPIIIDGPVVVPGDVILRGVVRGQGTIYAGRNIHIVGQLTYETPWRMPRLERNQSTGALRVKEDGMAVGTVCDNGHYVTPGGSVPAGCVAAPSSLGWVAYGYAVPGYGKMGFSEVPAFTNKYKTASEANSLGLSAKGNVIIGDYTSQGFRDRVKPKLQNIKQPYVIDASDAVLGYLDYSNAQGAPVFNGNYDRRDWAVNGQGQLVQGTKTDGTPRKFYESSLGNAALHQVNGVWQPIVNPGDPLYNTQDKARIDAVIYANHLVGGYVPNKGDRKLELNGTIIGRDDGLVVDSHFTLNHDNRLNMGDPNANGSAWLPVTISRPALNKWKECATADCS